MFPEEVIIFIEGEEVSGYILALDTMVFRDEGVSYPEPVAIVWVESEAKIMPISLEAVTLSNPKAFTKKLIEYKGLQKI
jgi:hypothetical protein